MLRLIVVFISLATMYLASISSAASADRIVFINPGKQGESFWENVTLSMQAAAEQLGFELDVQWAGRNKFNMQALGIAAAQSEDKPSLIILVNEERAALPIVVEAEKASVRTLFLSNALSAEDFASYEESHGAMRQMLGAVVPDMRLAGARMASALVDEAARLNLHSSDSKLHIVALAGDEISPTSIERTQGFMDFIQTRDDVIVERLLFAGWNETDAQRLTQRVIELMKRKDQTLAGVWAGNDPMAIGAINALKEAGLQPGEDSVVVGLNWSPEAIDHLSTGELLLTDGGHFLIGAWVLVAFADYLKGCDSLFGGDSLELKLATSALDAKTDPVLLKLIKGRDYQAINFRKFLRHGDNCRIYDFSTEAIVNALK